ncbi:GNAT family N-acetyltransferase [Nocardioides speluncae]|uniref:GNAT family N-acetyltransferase n=1 Tax=Nocardioides speluncae TaxID=2670337 RepID=UPI000D69ACBD|nr:GNAT family N-acetyltransferase [Nocardioides speluncae]
MAEVKDNPDAHRYEVWEDGQLAGFVRYRLDGDRIALVHTETVEAFAGRGLAKVLVTQTLDDVRARGLAVLPFCPYVKGFIAKNPDYLDLVPESERARFELSPA